MSKTSRISLASTSESSRTESATHDSLVLAAAQIVSAYIVNRGNEQINLLGLTAEVYGTLSQLARGGVATSTRRTPTVPVEESVKPEYLICLEDGKQVKMLKRYLRSNYNMSPEEYRARWNLPATYPMVAPNYAKVRSALAKKIGLGRRSTLLAPKRIKIERPSIR